MKQRDDERRAALKALRDGLREIERNEEPRGAQGAQRQLAPLHGPGATATTSARCAARSSSGARPTCTARALPGDARDRRACAARRVRAGDGGGLAVPDRRLDGVRWARAPRSRSGGTTSIRWSRRRSRTGTTRSSLPTLEAAPRRSGVARSGPCLTTSVGSILRWSCGRGGALAIGVATQRRIATIDDGARGAHIALFDEFLRLAGAQEGLPGGREAEPTRAARRRPSGRSR